MSIRTAAELAEFEKEIVRLTLGYSIKRCMAYHDFRRSIQKCHHMRVGVRIKCSLDQNHFISVEDGIAEFYRHIEEDHAEDVNDHIDDCIDDKPKKRVKSDNKSTK